MILVTGGTGFVGRAVVRRLREVGHRVKVFSRHPIEAFHHDPGIEFAKGEITHPGDLKAAMEGVTAVVHLVGIIKETWHHTFEDIHARGTANVVLAAQAAGVERFVMVSALGTRPHAASRYHTSKFHGEEALRTSGLDYTILRPSVIYGPKDHLVSAIRQYFRPPYSWMRCKLQPLPGGGESRVMPVYIRDVSEAVARSLVTAKTVGKTYDVVGPKAILWKEFFTLILKRLGAECVMEHLPVRTAIRLLSALLIVVLPVVLVVLLLLDHLHHLLFLAMFGLWVLAFCVAFFSRGWVFFTVPMTLLRWAGTAGDFFLPRALRFSQQVAMLEEDNVGDPHPLANDIGLVTMKFEDGLRKALPARGDDD